MARKPELDDGGWALALAFQKLSTERQIGMATGPIPIRAIWDWEDREGIFDPPLRDHVEAILMDVDARVCRRMRAAAEQKKPAPEQPPTPNRPPPKKRRR